MISHIPPRLRKPLARAIAGTALVGAWALGSPHWWLAIVEVTVLGRPAPLGRFPAAAEVPVTHSGVLQGGSYAL